MTARELFEALAPLAGPAIERAFRRRDLCILATRVAIETARYFGIHAAPMPVRIILYNEAFARHVADGFAGVDQTNVASWGDGSWSVGVGCGARPRPGGWDGHLIAVAGGYFGDYAIRQAERLEHGIFTGPALAGPYNEKTGSWRAIHPPTGTVIEYRATGDDSWRNAPDWKDAGRWRPIVAQLIRAVRAREAA